MHKFCSYTPRTIKNILVSFTAAAFMAVASQNQYFVNPVNVVLYNIGNKPMELLKKLKLGHPLELMQFNLWET
jgi:hypothetical protein|tara:strand:- start:4456 stop:4674 length:219 start_codon:yes stop_codon:yes gene_type:complete